MSSEGFSYLKLAWIDVRWGEPGVGAISLCACSSAERGRGPRLRCASIWNQTAPSASKRGLHRFSPSRILTVGFFNLTANMAIFYSQWSTPLRRRTLGAVWPALKLGGALAANAGWFRNLFLWRTCFHVKIFKVLFQVLLEVLQLSPERKTWSWRSACGHSWAGKRQLQVSSHFHNLSRRLHIPITVHPLSIQVCSSINHFTIRIAEAAMTSQFGSYSWQNSGVFCTPTLAKRAPVRFFEGSARRGNLGGRRGAMRGGLTARELLRNLAREEEQEEKGEKSDGDTNL